MSIKTIDPQSFSKNGRKQGETAKNDGLMKAQVNSESSFGSEALAITRE